MASVQSVFGCYPKIFSEQIPHCALIKPVSMQLPFTSWIDKPEVDQGLEHIDPSGTFPAGIQSIFPKFPQTEHFPKMAGKPARSPLTGTPQLQCTHSKLNPVFGFTWNRTV